MHRPRRLLLLLPAEAVSDVVLFFSSLSPRSDDHHHYRYVRFSCLKLLSSPGCFLGTTPAPQATPSKIRKRTWPRPAVMPPEIASAATTLACERTQSLEAYPEMTLHMIISHKNGGLNHSQTKPRGLIRCGSTSPFKLAGPLRRPRELRGASTQCVEVPGTAERAHEQPWRCSKSGAVAVSAAVRPLQDGKRTRRPSVPAGRRLRAGLWRGEV